MSEAQKWTAAALLGVIALVIVATLVELISLDAAPFILIALFVVLGVFLFTALRGRNRSSR